MQVAKCLEQFKNGNKTFDSNNKDLSTITISEEERSNCARELIQESFVLPQESGIMAKLSTKQPIKVVEKESIDFSQYKDLGPFNLYFPTLDPWTAGHYKLNS